MATRSFISVVMATRQPAPTASRRWLSGMRTSVKKTSLNSASPVIWRRGRTSTPGACMSTMKYVMPRCFGDIGVGARHEQSPTGGMGQRRPHLLAVDHPLVAVAYRPGGKTGHVRPGPGLAEELAPDLLAREERAEVARPLLFGAVGEERGGGHAVADDVAVRLVGRVDGAQLALDEALEFAGSGRGPPARPGTTPRPSRHRSGRRRTPPPAWKRGRDRRAGRGVGSGRGPRRLSQRR